MSKLADRIHTDEIIEPYMLEKWQKTLDLIAGMFAFPAAYIMRALSDAIEVFVHNTCPNSPFETGYKIKPGGDGIYCEAVINARHEISISNAYKAPEWRNSRAGKRGYISYLGFPVFWPNGDVFGTICVMDKVERFFTKYETGILDLAAMIIGDSLKALLDRNQLKNEIKQQQLAAEALRESEERFRKVFELSPVAVMITTAEDGRFIDANDACLTLVGVEKQEILGKAMTEFPMFGDSGKWFVARDKLRRDKKIRNQISYKKNKNGDNLKLNISVDSINVGDKPCLIATLHDLTAQKKLERQLKAANERLMLATSAAGIGIWEYDYKNSTFYWDDNMSRLYKTASNKVTYQAWLDCVHTEDRERCEHELEISLRSGAPYSSQFRSMLPDGGERILQANGQVVCDSIGKPVRMLGVNYDITDKVKAQMQLQASEIRLRRAQHMARVGNWEYHPDKKVFWASEEGLDMYGIGYESPFVDMTIIQSMVLREDRQMMDDAMQNLLDNSALYDMQFRIRRVDNGEIRVLHSVAEIGKSPENGAIAVKGVVQDITDYVHTEEQLVESERRYKALFDDTSAVHLVVDKQTAKITAANAAASAYYGWSVEQLCRMNLTDLNGLPLDQMQRKLCMAYNGMKTYYETDHRLANGEMRHVSAFSGPIDMDGGQYVHYVIHDITERKLAEKALAESEQRFRLFVENAPDSVFVQTRGKFVYVNNKTVDLFRAASEMDLIGQEVAAHFAHDFRIIVKNLIQRPKGLAVPLKEEMIIRKDGSSLDVEVSAVPFRYQGKGGALVFMRDISQRRQMEKKNESMEAQLQQKQKLEAIGTLAGGVAHEINNPVTGIINYAQLMSESPAADQEIQNFCNEIIHEGRRIAEIVSSLLMFARQEKKTHSPAAISDIVQDTLMLTRTILRHDQITLEVDIPDGLPTVKCRSQQIQQVLMNLITNARDALNAKYKDFDENKKIIISCNIFEKEGRGWLRLMVEDRGTGIPADVMDKIFDPFFTTKPRDKGTGLGLSISHGIVREHHGEFYFDTLLGEFTRAIIELPVDNGWCIE